MRSIKAYPQIIPYFICSQTTANQCGEECKSLCLAAKQQRRHSGACIDDQHRSYANGKSLGCQINGNNKCTEATGTERFHQCDCDVSCLPLVDKGIETWSNVI